MQIWEGAEHRIPSLAQAEINTFVNGPESFTTDNQVRVRVTTST
jgi:hypothetical protein